MRTLEISLALRRGALSLDVALSTAAPLALIGPNGAGKSTLLRCVLGVLRPDAGRIALGGRVLFDAAAGIDVPTEARRLGFVPQDHGLFPHLTVAGNVAFGVPAALRGAERRARVSHWLERLGLVALADRRPAALSGGERQRVALARALAAEPAALLLDEPMASLDVPARRATRSLLAEVLRDSGVPALVVTHDFADVRALGGEVAVLEAGRLVQRGTPAALAAAPGADFVAAVVAEAAEASEPHALHREPEDPEQHRRDADARRR
jgi:ABC-type sulfate/molybdate transport systems ATPase subunit